MISCNVILYVCGGASSKLPDYCTRFALVHLFQSGHLKRAAGRPATFTPRLRDIDFDMLFLAIFGHFGQISGRPSWARKGQAAPSKLRCWGVDLGMVFLVILGHFWPSGSPYSGGNSASGSCRECVLWAPFLCPKRVFMTMLL